MPIYEYECVKCSRQFEYLARRLEHKPDACPGCGSRKLKKALSGFSVASSAPAPLCGGNAGNAAACRACPAQGNCHQ